MMPTIVPLYASALGLLFARLSWRALTLRRSYKVGVGDGGILDLRKALRAHANFAEYTPITVFLLYMLEAAALYPSVLLHGLSLALCIGRVSHAYGVSQVNENYRYRVFGMVITLAVLSSAALLNLAGSLMVFLSQ